MMIRAPQAKRIVRPTTRDDIVRITAMVPIRIGVSCFAFPRPFEFDWQFFEWQFFFWLAVPLFIVFNIVYDLIFIEASDLRCRPNCCQKYNISGGWRLRAYEVIRIVLASCDPVSDRIPAPRCLRLCLSRQTPR